MIRQNPRMDVDKAWKRLENERGFIPVAIYAILRDLESRIVEIEKKCLVPAEIAAEAQPLGVPATPGATSGGLTDGPSGGRMVPNPEKPKRRP